LVFFDSLVVDLQWFAVCPGDAPARLEEFHLFMEHFTGWVILLIMNDDSLGCIINDKLKP
jgi:hypothetical protein